MPLVHACSFMIGNWLGYEVLWSSGQGRPALGCYASLLSSKSHLSSIAVIGAFAKSSCLRFSQSPSLSRLQRSFERCLFHYGFLLFEFCFSESIWTICSWEVPACRRQNCSPCNHWRNLVWPWCCCSTLCSFVLCYSGRCHGWTSNESSGLRSVSGLTGDAWASTFLSLVWMLATSWSWFGLIWNSQLAFKCKTFSSM